jgi:hypothetical protein
MSGKPDIHALHVEKTHAARGVVMQTQYTNGGDIATILDLDKAKNIQYGLEQYFSLVGIPKTGIEPIGDKDSLNLVYETPEEFVVGTLEVFLSGDKLDPQDFLVTNTGPEANRQFTIVLNPNDPERLNAPPFQNEPLTVSYSKRITFNTRGGT